MRFSEAFGACYWPESGLVVTQGQPCDSRLPGLDTVFVCLFVQLDTQGCDTKENEAMKFVQLA